MSNDIKTKIEDMPTVYNAKETEERIYKFWEDGEYFKADSHSKKPPSECYRCSAYGACS